MKHEACGGTVDTTAPKPFCDKCGWSIGAVEKDNIKFAAKQAEKNKPWWNTKRFKTEKEALLYRSESAHDVYMLANQMFMEAPYKKYSAKMYDSIAKAYAKAAKAAVDDDDVVSSAIYDSFQGMVETHRAEHETEYPEGRPTNAEANSEDDPQPGVRVAG